MQDTITIREIFTSRQDAEAARHRLERAEFPPNSVEVRSLGTQFELAIRTRLADRERAQACISESGFLSQVGHYAREHALRLARPCCFSAALA